MIRQQYRTVCGTAASCHWLHNLIVSTNDPDDDVGRDADSSSMTAMRAFDLFVDAATKFIAICCSAQ
jgi:hypothetical protein